MHQMLLETFYKRLTEEKGYFINGVSRQVCPGRAGGGNKKKIIYIYLYPGWEKDSSSTPGVQKDTTISVNLSTTKKDH